MLNSCRLLQSKSLALVALWFLLLAPPAALAQDTRPDAKAFAEFWTAFRRTVLRNDKVSVASMTKFPLVGDYPTPSKEIFLRKYRKIFRIGFRRLVTASKPYVNASGGYSVIYRDRLYMSFEKEGDTYRLTEMGSYH